MSMQPEDESSRLSGAFDRSTAALNAIRFPETTRIWAVPAPISNFVNRTDHLGIACELALSDHPGPHVLAIHGVSGSGKSTLLEQLAARVGEHFDHAIRVPLRNFPGGAMEDVLGYVLGALKIDLSEVLPDAASRHTRLLSATAGLRILLLVDDARDAAQIRLLTPNSPGAMVIAAGDIRLDDLRIDGFVVKRLDGLDTPHALELLSAILGNDRLRDAEDAVGRLVKLCDGSPLGLKTVARQLLLQDDLSLPELVAQLESRTGIAEPTPTAAQLRRAMTAIFDSAYDLLMNSEVSTAYRVLGAVPGDRWPKEVVRAVLTAAGVDSGQAVGRLVQLDFLRPVSGGYALPYLIGIHAEQVATKSPPANRGQLCARTVRAWLALAAAADQGVQRERFRITPAGVAASVGFASAKHAMEWLETWHDSIFEVIESAAAQGLSTEAWQLFEACWPFYTSHSRYVEWIKAGTVAVDAAVLSQDKWAETRSRCYRSRGWTEQGDFGQADDDIRLALELSSVIKDPMLHASVLDFEGQLRLREGRAEEALACFSESLRINQQLGDQRGIALQSQFCGRSLGLLGRNDEALVLLAEALRLIRPFEDHRAESKTLYSTARVLRALDRKDEAVAALTDALTLAAELGKTSLVVPPLELLAELAKQAADEAAEAGYLRKLQEIFASSGDPRVANVENRLRELSEE
ncbi:tetratricopeptide repeat protein [Kribbella antibiotica]|uniref:Tetratricopeptide repeat protein n=1 Tax=Kribbella antibiotica TaxID=190195 RepID=A0A4R4ZJD6_9ACTN|nr:tetratricopeptide repeat protein [Kribbella antibiotica]TDD57669.1 tetratricopeptide repeat protein [Kribbella antibiotica]